MTIHCKIHSVANDLYKNATFILLTTCIVSDVISRTWKLNAHKQLYVKLSYVSSLARSHTCVLCTLHRGTPPLQMHTYKSEGEPTNSQLFRWPSIFVKPADHPTPTAPPVSSSPPNRYIYTLPVRSHRRLQSPLEYLKKTFTNRPKEFLFQYNHVHFGSIITC